jgi:hypothetical protein
LPRAFLYNGRNERIRTSGPLLPKQVRYQAALHSDGVFREALFLTFSTAFVNLKMHQDGCRCQKGDADQRTVTVCEGDVGRSRHWRLTRIGAVRQQAVVRVIAAPDRLLALVFRLQG